MGRNVQVRARAGELPVPDFYRPGHASDYRYAPDAAAVFEAAIEHRRTHRLEPAASDRRRLHLLLIDTQKDFCFPQGTLYVGGRSGNGAVEDSDRIARFIYRNLGVISEVTCTMDTHFPHQIFFPSFWIDADGAPLTAHRPIASREVRAGSVKPNPAIASWLCGGDYTWLCKQAEHYCSELERSAKHALYLWPPHCLLGSDGHALAGVIQEARLFHSFARSSKAAIELKGDNALTENYSALSPEVMSRHDGAPLLHRNAPLIEALLESDAVVIAGQAASHCVRSSIEDLLEEIRRRDERLARKLYVLEDCMSSVAVPDPAHPGRFLFDFTREAEQALDRFAAAGVNIVQSSEEIGSWLTFAH